jgi:membrane protease subunit (stomatin/prohibitin family)
MKFFNVNTLTDYFRGLYITRVKDRISSCLVQSKISLLEINAHLNEISAGLADKLRPELEEYGIELASFYVNDINVPENDPAVKQLKAALAKRAEMDIIGYNYQQERTFNTLENAADNQGTAGMVMGSGIGLGMGFGVGGAIASQASTMQGAMSSVDDQIECPNCHERIAKSSKFCPNCGVSPTKPQKQIKCSVCGKSLSEGTKFCPECGRRLALCPQCGADIPDGATSCPSCNSRFCPQCNTMLAADAKFCPECGYTVVKKCVQCGEVVADGQKFCPNCGTKVM